MKKLLRSAAALCLCITLIIITELTSYADVAFEPEELFVRDKNSVILGAILAVVPIIISAILIMLFWRKKPSTGPQKTENMDTAGTDTAADKAGDRENE